MNPADIFLLAPGFALASSVMLALWQRQRHTRDATAVDVAWALLLAALATLYAVCADGLVARRAIVALVVVIACGRLGWHLFVDRVRKGVEDGRYRTLRERWGRHADRNFFWFFQAQALLDVLLSLPFLIACASGAELSWLDLAAIVLALIALAGEWTADRQLARFRADAARRGLTCRAGLWRVSRHPNYFFQWLSWCAYALFAASAPLGWVGVLSPLLMLFLILRVTGIPPTEAQALRSRGADYREYQRTTSVFIPWFPRRSHA